MQLNVKLNKNFTTAFNRMQEEYGEEFSKINGFSDMQLSYTDFIQNFIDTDTVADASVDGNIKLCAGLVAVDALFLEVHDHV